MGSATHRLTLKRNPSAPKYRWMSYCGDVVIKNAAEDVLRLEIIFD